MNNHYLERPEWLGPIRVPEVLDIPMTDASTPERKALVAIIHDVKGARLRIGLQDVVLDHLANIERNARAALQEGAAA